MAESAPFGRQSWSPDSHRFPIPARTSLLTGWLGGRQDKKQQIQKELEGVIRAPGLRCPGLVFQERLAG